MKRLLIVIAIVLLCGCQEHVRNEKANDISTITIIFKDPPSSNLTIRRGLNGKISYFAPHALLYIDTCGVPIEIKTFLPDTLVIHTGGRPYVEVEHYARAIENLYFLLQAGDTVVFAYDSLNIPTVYSRLGSKNTFQYNLYARRKFNGMFCNTSLINIANRNYCTFCFPNDLDIDSLQHVARLQLRQQFIKDGIFYDSVYHAGLIDRAHFEHICHLRRIDSLDVFDNRAKKRGSPVDSKVAQLPDTLFLHYPSYLTAFYNYTYDYVLPRYGGTWLGVFNGVAKDTMLTEMQRYNTLYQSFKMICNQFLNQNKYSKEQMLEFAQHYLSLAGDTAKYNYVLQKINRQQPIMLTDNLALADLKGGATILDSVIAQNRGKVIYVDFWASWCGPCRAQMPDAQKLRERYRGKDVAFVYLALNDVQERWLEAVREEHLNDTSCQNYIITNPKRARFIEEHRIHRIPRFMLFDRQGRLVDNDAPRPMNPKIVSAIDDLLK